MPHVGSEHVSLQKAMIHVSLVVLLSVALDVVCDWRNTTIAHFFGNSRGRCRSAAHKNLSVETSRKSCSPARYLRQATKLVVAGSGSDKLTTALSTGTRPILCVRR